MLTVRYHSCGRASTSNTNNLSVYFTLQAGVRQRQAYLLLRQEYVKRRYQNESENFNLASHDVSDNLATIAFPYLFL